MKRIASVLTVLALALLALAQAAQASPGQLRTTAQTTVKSRAGASTRSGAATPATDLPSKSDTSATSAENLSVDLGATQGSFGHGADGSLYGLYDQGVPSDNLIQGMGLQTTDTKAQDGQQHPGSDALEIAKPFVSSGGSDIYIYMTDVYRNFPYERTSYAQYQGYMRTEIKQDLTSPDRNRIVLVPYNEPDGNWFAGPNFFQYQGQALTSFLAYCQQNH